MISSGINFVNFEKKYKKKKILRELNRLIKENNPIIKSLSKEYKDNFDKKKISKYKKFSNFRLLGMGGSSLGAQSIYSFLKKKINKNFYFIDNLQPKKNKNNKKFVNLIISKSGNTIETITNTNVLIKRNDKNIFITENKKNYLYLLANKLKAEVIHHNNFIGGRYSVLSEVGMLPAELMGLKSKEFRQLKRNADGDIVKIYNIFHLLTDKQIDRLTDDDWSRVNEYQLEFTL